jgi:hypothetical protein
MMMASYRVSFRNSELDVYIPECIENGVFEHRDFYYAFYHNMTIGDIGGLCDLSPNFYHDIIMED